mgnify:CR=1 FL=1
MGKDIANVAIQRAEWAHNRRTKAGYIAPLHLAAWAEAVLTKAAGPNVQYRIRRYHTGEKTPAAQRWGVRCVNLDWMGSGHEAPGGFIYDPVQAARIAETIFPEVAA